MGGFCGELAGVDSPWGMRRTALSTLDSNTEGRLWVPRPFSTMDSDPAAVLYLRQRCLARARCSRAAGQIASLSPGSYREP